MVSINLLTTKIAGDFLTQDRDSFIQSCFSGKYKTHFKAETEVEAYGKALLELGFGEESLFNIKDPVSLAENYVLYLINYKYPITELEYKICENFSEDMKKNMVETPMKYLEIDKIDGHDLNQDKYFKSITAARFIFKSFCNLTRYYDEFLAGKIDGEKLVDHITEYITKNVEVVLDDTNIAYTIPTRINQNSKVRVYVPESVGLIGNAPIDFLVNEVVDEINESSKYGFGTSIYRKTLTMFSGDTNPYLFYIDEEKVYTVCELDTLSRKYQYRTIEEYLKPIFLIGKPVVQKLDNGTQLTIYGNCSKSLLVFVDSSYFIVDPELFGAARKQLNDRKSCSINKQIGVVRDGEKTLLWDLIFTNSKPADKNYNHILRKNIL